GIWIVAPDAVTRGAIVGFRFRPVLAPFGFAPFLDEAVRLVPRQPRLSRAVMPHDDGQRNQEPEEKQPTFHTVTSIAFGRTLVFAVSALFTTGFHALPNHSSN